MPRDDATLFDIARAARLAIEFAADADYVTFVQDAKTQSAVLHQLMVIGEAVKRLSPEFRAGHPATPWTLIAGMRDKLIHAYDEVDLEQVWKTLQEDLPALLAGLDASFPKDAG